jgi:hypothetical protein
MGRIPTDGITYFNIDCAQEDNLNYLEAKHGITGYGVWVKLLRKIFMIKGYYCEWTEKNIYLFSKEIGVDVDKIKDIVATCLSEGLFHQGMLEKYSILTSSGIQKRWIRIVTEAKRKGCSVDEKYALFGKTPEETPKTPEFIAKTPEEKPQRKEKEKKEKKNKEKIPTGGVPAAPSPPKNPVKVKVEETEPYWQKLVDAWFEFSTQKFGEPPSFSRDDPKILKRIIALLKKRAAAKSVEWTEAAAIERFNLFLARAFDDDWLSKHFLLANLEKQFDVIVQQQKPEKKETTPASSLQFIYELYCENGKGWNLLKEPHFDLVPDLPWKVCMNKAVEARINNLLGSNQRRDILLMDAYQHGQVTKETQEDIPNLELIAKRTAMFNFFATNKHNQVKKLL